MFQETVLDHRTLENGARYIRSKPDKKTRSNEEKIQELWDRLDSGRISPKQFIDAVKYRMGGGGFGE